MKILKTFLTRSIDYAGLFPPAKLEMQEAMKNYAKYREGEDRWLLARFILPLDRVHEFDSAARTLHPVPAGKTPWHLSVLSSGDPADDLLRITEFNQSQAGSGGHIRALIDTVETKATSVEEIRRVAKIFSKPLNVIFEIPIREDPQPLVDAIATVGATAKVRTGGTSTEMFPTSNDLLRFISACRKSRISFKATAGLHHALRGCYPLTYEEKSPKGMMFGFLNVFLASAFVDAGKSIEEATCVLEEGSVQKFEFKEESISYGTLSLDATQLQATRNCLATSFGSCSFTEPINELKSYHLLS